MVSKRDLREDPVFDSLINKLFPKRKEIYEKEQEDLRKLVSSHASSLQESAAAHGVLLEDGEEKGTQNKGTRKARKKRERKDRDKDKDKAEKDNEKDKDKPTALSPKIPKMGKAPTQSQLDRLEKASDQSTLENQNSDDDSLSTSTYNRSTIGKRSYASSTKSSNKFVINDSDEFDIDSQSSVVSHTTNRSNIADIEGVDRELSRRAEIRNREKKERLNSVRENDVLEKYLYDSSDSISKDSQQNHSEKEIFITFKIFTSKKQMDSAREQLYLSFKLKEIFGESLEGLENGNFCHVKIGHLAKLLSGFKRFEGYSNGIEIGQLDQYCSFKTLSNDLNFLGVLGRLDANKSCVLYVRRARKAKL